MLPVLGLLAAAWALIPPYSGPEINTAMRVEVADHVVPAIVLVAVSLWALVVVRARTEPGSALLVAGLVVLLAGLWMTATHVPLIRQARQDVVSNAAAAYHSAPGLAVLLLGLVWSAKEWGRTP